MINVNLLPPELKLKRIEAKRNASLIGICLVIVLVVAVIAVIGRSLEATVKDRLSAAKSEVEKNTGQLEESKDLENLALLINDRAKTTDTINKTRVIWSQVIQELANSAPADVQFDNLTANSEKSPNFILQGNTTTEREIIKFKEKLENSPVFKNVNFKNSSLQNDSTTQTQKLKFTLEFDLEKINLTGAVSGSADFKRVQ